MVAKKVIRPALPPVKKLSRSVSRTTVAKLVRDNVITISKDFTAQDKDHNRRLKEYRTWDDAGRKNPNKYSQALIEYYERAEEVPETRWTQSQLGKTIGVSTTVVRKIFATSASKRTGSVSITDVISLAIALGVTPGFLLQPNQKQLENDAELHISGILKQPLKIGAHEWFMWIHSFAPLPHIDNEYFELRMAQLDTVENMNYEEPKAVMAGTELNRIAKSSYFSDLAPTMAAHELFFPQLYPEVSGPSHLDDVKRKYHASERDLVVFRNKVSLMTHVRRAIRLMSEFESETDTKKAIRWSANNIAHTLAAIARNRSKPLK